MKNCLNALSILLAAICAGLFVITTSLILFFWVGERLFLSPGTYIQALRSQQIYDQLPALISEQIIYQNQHASFGTGLPTGLGQLTQDDWQILLSDLLPPAELQNQTESVIDQFFVYLNTPGTPLNLQISLVDFKQQLDSDAGYRAVIQLIELRPACSSGEWSLILSGLRTALFEDIPNCRPPDDVLASSEPYIRSAIHIVVAALPDETTLSSTTSSNLVRKDGRLTLQRMRRLTWLSLCLPAGLLLLVAGFGVRSFTSGGLWLGLPLATTGLIGLIGAAVTWGLPSWLLARSAPSGTLTLEGAAPGVTQVMVNVGVALAHNAARTIGLISVLLVVLGVGILIAGFLFGWATRSGMEL